MSRAPAFHTHHGHPHHKGHSRRAATPPRPAPVLQRTDDELDRLRTENKTLGEWKRRLGLLLEFGKRMAAETSLESLLQILVDETKLILQADRCTVFLVDRKSKELWSKVAHGIGEGIIRVPLDRGLAGYVARTGQIVNIDDAYRDDRFNPEVDRKTGYHTRTILAAPMRNIQGEIIGVFQVINREFGVFTQGDEELLVLLASQAGIAVENATLADELRNATLDTIFRLSVAAEYKDQDTALHLKRMSNYSAVIADAMGFSSGYCQTLLWASPMHDIGKLGVPDSIMMKPGKLTDEEFARMKEHTVFGARILENAKTDLLRFCQSIALTHHEKWDGTGYPRGLKGEAIPIEGRLAALGDVFDALTSRRVYKPAFSMEETLRIVQESAGNHFDPQVVAAFMKRIPEITEVMTRLQEPAPDPAPGGVAGRH